MKKVFIILLLLLGTCVSSYGQEKKYKFELAGGTAWNNEGISVESLDLGYNISKNFYLVFQGGISRKIKTKNTRISYASLGLRLSGKLTNNINLVPTFALGIGKGIDIEKDDKFKFASNFGVELRSIISKNILCSMFLQSVSCDFNEKSLNLIGIKIGLLL